MTPSFNQGPFIERCIRSVLAQDYPNFEHIVCDNCSTDDTLEIVRRYRHIQWVSEPDRGQSDAINKGFRRARGEIIAWINADDYYEPGVFELAARELRRETGVMAIAGRVKLVDPGGRVTETTTPCFEGLDYLVAYWAGGYGLCQPGVLFRREILERIGYLREDLHYAMDYDFWLRLAEQYPVKTVDLVLAGYIVHPASKSGGARFGEGFNEELAQVSRRYWGSRLSRRYWRFARGSSRFAADQLTNAIVWSHRYHDAVDWTSLWRLVRRRPLSVFRRHLIAVALERLLGVKTWSAFKRRLGISASEDNPAER